MTILGTKYYVRFAIKVNKIHLSYGHMGKYSRVNKVFSLTAAPRGIYYILRLRLSIFVFNLKHRYIRYSVRAQSSLLLRQEKVSGIFMVSGILYNDIRP